MGAGKSSISGYPIQNFKLPSINTAPGTEYDVRGGVLSNDGSYDCRNLIDFPLSFEKNGKLDRKQFPLYSGINAYVDGNMWSAAAEMWGHLSRAAPKYTKGVKNSGIQELKKMSKYIKWGGIEDLERGIENVGSYHPFDFQEQAFLIAHQKGKSSNTYSGPAIPYPPIGVNAKSSIKAMVRTNDSLTINLYRSSSCKSRRYYNYKLTSR
jgi:hypothetical protein